MTEQTWQDELVARFAARADPRLRRARMPQLAKVADELLPDPTGDDVDLVDLVRFAVAFADSQESHFADHSRTALRAGGGAFLHATTQPIGSDVTLIAKGNGAKQTVDIATKAARDTWSYMSYRRALNDDRRGFYTYKQGMGMRSEFRDALVEAVHAALRSPDDFRDFAREQQRGEIAAYGVHYSDPREGALSVATRIDRSQWIRDVTIPDGSLVPIGARFTKVWEIRNAGQIPWISRRLKRTTPQGPTMPWSEDSIPIPDTWPGEIVQLSVDFVAARVQGSTYVRFKMTDQEGNFCFPNKYAHGLSMLIETGDFSWLDRKFDVEGA